MAERDSCCDEIIELRAEYKALKEEIAAMKSDKDKKNTSVLTILGIACSIFVGFGIVAVNQTFAIKDGITDIKTEVASLKPQIEAIGQRLDDHINKK